VLPLPSVNLVSRPALGNCHGSVTWVWRIRSHYRLETVSQLALEPKWIKWSRQLMAIAQNGLTYAQDHFDVERYGQIRTVAAEMMAEYSEWDDQEIFRQFAKEDGYATPKVDVRGAVFREHQILLVKERADGRWALPGGWADVNESPREAVEREILEESGFQTRAGKLLALWDRAKQPSQSAIPLSHLQDLHTL
jgi:hypothetical protein